jgi:hypothetical protein
MPSFPPSVASWRTSQSWLAWASGRMERRTASGKGRPSTADLAQENEKHPVSGVLEVVWSAQAAQDEESLQERDHVRGRMAP